MVTVVPWGPGEILVSASAHIIARPCPRCAPGAAWRHCPWSRTTILTPPSAISVSTSTIGSLDRVAGGLAGCQENVVALVVGQGGSAEKLTQLPAKRGDRTLDRMKSPSSSAPLHVTFPGLVRRPAATAGQRRQPNTGVQRRVEVVGEGAAATRHRGTVPATGSTEPGGRPTNLLMIGRTPRAELRDAHGRTPRA